MPRTFITTSFRQAGATQTNYHQVDLSPFSAKHLDSFPPGECWSEVPRGEQIFAGIPFRVVNVVELTGLGTARADNKFFPSRIENIPAECSGHRIHVLHGTGFDAPDGAPIAKLVLKYVDGSAQPFYICYGVHTRNWWRERSEVNSALSDPNSEVAWTCVRPGYSLRLFKTAFMNPYPERKISGIDLYSLLSRATPVILGITIEANPALSQSRESDPVAVDETGLRREMRLRFVDSQEQPVKEVTAVLTFRAAVEQSRSYEVQVNPKGSFQVDEVAPGEYNLVIMFAEGNFGLTRSIQQRVDVPAGPVDEPVDLGDVSLSRPR